jgi:integrase
MIAIPRMRQEISRMVLSFIRRWVYSTPRGAWRWFRSRPLTVPLSIISPHKFRHGHAVYAVKMAKDVSALKAVSQNLTHENLSITDGVYGVLSETDVRQQIATLGNGTANSEDAQELRSLVGRLLVKLERSDGT